MRPMTLNDGTFIYSIDGLREYLISLGFDWQDFQEMLVDAAKIDDSIWVRRDEIDDYERFYDGLCQDVDCAVDEINCLCNQLASGKGGTKVQYADRIKTVLKNFFDN